MKLKELLDVMTYGVRYKLIGAKTGKYLADSNTNKKGYIQAFWDDDVSGFFPSFDAPKDNITKMPRYINPIICIWLIGR